MNEKIYIVMRNSDTIEGKGHDLIQKVFKTHEDSVNYIKEEREKAFQIAKNGEWGKYINEPKKTERTYCFEWDDGTVVERYEDYSICICNLY